jgi:hypothetical protein
MLAGIYPEHATARGSKPNENTVFVVAPNVNPK